MLPLAALLLTSCNKWETVSFEDAKKFVEANYDQSASPKEIKKGGVEIKGHAKDEASKAVAADYLYTEAYLEGVEFDTNTLYGYLDYKDKHFEQHVIKASEMTDAWTYSTNGKKLKRYIVDEAKIGQYTFNETRTFIHGDEGFPTEFKREGKYKDDTIEFSFEITKTFKY